MTLRWGIVSAGKISHDFVTAFQSYPKLEGQKIAAVAAKDEKRAAAFAKLHNIQHVFPSYEAMATSNEIDIAYIGNLNHEHYACTKLFLENGKHVLCEKPLTLNYKQAKHLVDLAKKKKLFLMEAIWSRFLPIYDVLVEELNKIGEVVFVEANFGVKIAEVERLKNLEFGGGSLLDLGTYVLQLAQLVFKDDPTKITSVGELSKEGVDVITTIVLEYSGMRRAVLNSHMNANLDNRATIVGTKGKIIIPEPFHSPTEIVLSNGEVKKIPHHEASLPYNFGNSAGLVYQALEVKKCIQAGLIESPRLSHKDILALAQQKDTIRKQIGMRFKEDDMEFK